MEGASLCPALETPIVVQPEEYCPTGMITWVLKYDHNQVVSAKSGDLDRMVSPSEDLQLDLERWHTPQIDLFAY